jgi:hypothetical protein
MTDQKKLKVIEEAFNYYHDRNSLTSKDEKELLNLVNELYAAIYVTRCCDKLKGKKAMTFEDWLKVNDYQYNSNEYVKYNKTYYYTDLKQKYTKGINNL